LTTNQSKIEIKKQVIDEYLTQEIGYRQLRKKYGVSRTTIKKWVMTHQGIHNLPPTTLKQKYYHSSMNSDPKNLHLKW
jgi:transposase